MKITEEKLIEMGFSKIEGSINPIYYEHPCLPQYWVGMDRKGICRFKPTFDMDAATLEQKMIYTSDLISNMVYEATEIGKQLRSKEIAELIG